jgi:hypothetical protein
MRCNGTSDLVQSIVFTHAAYNILLLVQRLSRNVRKFVADYIRQNVPTPDIIKHVQDHYLRPYMVQHGILDPAVARERYLKDNPHRDFFITSDDVNNIRRKIDCTDWMRHPNPLESLRLWWNDQSQEVLSLFLQLS